MRRSSARPNRPSSVRPSLSNKHGGNEPASGEKVVKRTSLKTALNGVNGEL